MLDDASIPGTASIHEASGRIGALPSSLKPIAPTMRAHGPAVTVRCTPGDNLWIHRAMIAATPGSILIVDCGSGDEFGYWGEIMATSAVALGLAGIVITGGVRDSLALIELDFPTFAGRICIQGTGKDPLGDGAVNEPVRIGNVCIRPGDMIFADADGVLALRPEVATASLAAARERDRKEIEILRRVRAGEPTLEVYDLG